MQSWKRWRESEGASEREREAAQNLKVYNFTPLFHPRQHQFQFHQFFLIPFTYLYPSHCSITVPELPPHPYPRLQKRKKKKNPLASLSHASSLPQTRLQPPAELNGLCRCQGSRVRSLPLSSAQLCSAGLPAL